MWPARLQKYSAANPLRSPAPPLKRLDTKVQNCAVSRRAAGEPRAALVGEKRPRLRWNLQLHALFVAAVAGLGGPEKAQPRTIQQAMHVEGLTLFHVKSHLQKYRRSLRTDADALDTTAEPCKRPARRRAHYCCHPAQQHAPAAGASVPPSTAAPRGQGGVSGRRRAEPRLPAGQGAGAGLEHWLSEAAGGNPKSEAMAALQAGSAQLALQKRLEAHMEVPLLAHTKLMIPFRLASCSQSHPR